MNEHELCQLIQRAKRIGAVVRRDVTSIQITGLVGIGPQKMPLIQGAEALRKALALYHA